MEESVKKEQRQYWAVNRTFHSSMFEEVFKVGGKVIFYTISLEKLKEISENTPINMRFLGNGVPYKNALDKVGVKYKTITDDVVLSIRMYLTLLLVTQLLKKIKRNFLTILRS